jgi:hypothetical protein
MPVKLRDDSRLRNDLSVAFRQRLTDPHSPTPPLIDNFKLVILITLALSPIFERYLTVSGMHRPLHFTTPANTDGNGDARPPTFLVRTSYVIMATKTGPHAVSTMLPIA